MQRLYIDLGLDPHAPRAALTGSAPPPLAGILGAPLNLSVAFCRNGEQEGLAADSTGKFTVKAVGSRAGAALFTDITMSAEGSGAATVYGFSGRLLSDELIDAVGEEESVVLKGCVTWTEPDEDEERCLDFDFTLFNSAARDGDSIPATTDARWEWAKLLLPEENGFTHDEETKTISVDTGTVPSHANTHTSAGSDPITLAQSQVANLTTDLAAKAAAADLSSHTGNTSNPHAVTKTQVGLGNCDNTSDVDKPVSTSTQTALDGKTPTARTITAAGLATGGGDLSANRTITVPAASQAEAEDGTENTKAMTAARVHQAITARAITRGAGQISGHNDPGSAATPPSNLSVGFASAAAVGVTIADELVSLVFTFAISDPSDGSVWIDNTSLTNVEDYAAALASAFAGVAPSNLSINNEGSGNLSVSNSNTGAAASLSGSASNGNAVVTGGGIGTDAGPPSGAVEEALLVNMISGKVTRAVRCGFVTGGAGISETVEIALKQGGTYTRLGSVGPMGNGQREECFITAETIDAWLMGITNAQIVLRFSGTVPFGGEITGWAMADHHQS